MKRDINLMRQIMLDLEALPCIHTNISEIWLDRNLDDYQTIALHVKLLADSNYLELGNCLLGYDFENWHINRITNDGYTFLEYVRNDTIWNTLRSKLTALGSIALRIVEPLATDVIRAL